MDELRISFTDCAVIPQEPQLAVPAAELDGAPVITVRTTENTAYTFIEEAARRVCGWITVTAVQMVRVLIARVRAFVRTILPLSGSEILLQSAILNI